VKNLHDLYFGPGAMYAANKLVPKLDNVDQRIATDTQLLTEKFGLLAFGARDQTSILQPLVQGIIGLILAA